MLTPKSKKYLENDSQNYQEEIHKHFPISVFEFATSDWRLIIKPLATKDSHCGNQFHGLCFDMSRVQHRLNLCHELSFRFD